MNPITHILAGWTIGSLSVLEKRDRCLVTIAGIAPDIDGVGIVSELLTEYSNINLNWWSEYHHVLGHNLGFGFLIAILCGAAANRKPLTAFLAFFSFHIHLLGDILGARGPDGYQWPIAYLYPFNEKVQLLWGKQWALNAWPNFAITTILVVIVLRAGWKHGITPLELVSKRANEILVDTIRNRFGSPKAT